MKKMGLFVFFVCLWATTTVVWADTFGTGSNQFTIDFVTILYNGISVGAGYGTGVTCDYRMGTTEITNAQWTKFRAAYGRVTGNVWDAYDQTSAFTGANVPTTNVSWYEAAQFVNWLNTSTGHQAAYKFTGTQGMSDYTFNLWESGDAGYDTSNPFRNSNTHYFLPTENEWVKAAFWNGSKLQTYANASAADLVSGTPDPAKWNYYPSVGSEPWAVGSGVKEINGTYDMMGNVWELLESPDLFFRGEYTSEAGRGIRGGSYNYSSYQIVSSYRSNTGPGNEYYDIGFRVASVPEPATLMLLTLGGLLLRGRK